MSFLKSIVAPVLGAAGTYFGGPIGGSIGSAIGGAIAGNSQRGSAAAGATSAGQQGAAAATYHPVNSTNPFGSITNGPNGMTYTQNADTAGRSRMFSNMAGQAGSLAGQAGQQIAGSGQFFNNLGQQYAGGAQAAGANFTGAGNRMLQAMGNFGPQQYSNQAYNNMAAMAAPKNTSDTQNLFNNLQSTGRLGLTQNGELGDIGGLALAQKTADNQMRMQAMQMGQSQQQLMGNQASQFAGMGLNQTQGYGQLGSQFAGVGNNQQNSAVARYGDLSQTAQGNNQSVNQNGQQMIPFAQMANNQATSAAQAGGTAGQFLYNGQNARNNVNGSYNGGMNEQLGGVANQVGSWLGNYFNPPSYQGPQVDQVMPTNDQMIQPVSGPDMNFSMPNFNI